MLLRLERKGWRRWWCRKGAVRVEKTFLSLRGFYWLLNYLAEQKICRLRARLVEYRHITTRLYELMASGIFV